MGLFRSNKERYAYHSLKEGSESYTKEPRKVGIPKKRILKGVAISVVFMVAVLAFLIPRTSKSSLASSKLEISKPRHLRILIPASKSDVNLCKTLLSLSVLGYPAPVLINWGKTFNEIGDVFGGSHLAKITGVLTYLDNLSSRYDDDLVLFMDGYDVWFQLRPEVMLQRYFDIVERGNNRLRKRVGGRILRREGISQKIIFSTQKRCWPKEPGHPACFAVPESDLPEGIYGPGTDTDVGDENNPYLKFRQRYLNSGAAIGPVKDMRRLFRRAFEEVLVDKGFGSDQAIFASILGKQEFQREVVRQRNRSFFRSLLDTIGYRLGRKQDLLDPKTDPEHNLMPHFAGVPWEFGIGLDYRGEITFPTVWAEWDTEWLRFNETSRRLDVSREYNVAPHEQPFPSDILNSRRPFDSLGISRGGSQLPSKDMSWEDVPLFTNLWTGVIPAAAHHNAMLFNLKDRLQTHWNRTWFQPYARALLRNHILESNGPVARVVDNDGVSQEYWGTSIERGGVTTDTGSYEPYGLLCPFTEEIVFDDGIGAWRDPLLYEHTPPLIKA